MANHPAYRDRAPASPETGHRGLDTTSQPGQLHILVVEDFQPFCQFIFSTIQQKPQWCVICAVTDGLEAVQKAEELQPDLILLDIGLPRLNGIEAAKRIIQVAPRAKILFLTQEASRDVVQKALNLGARGYILKAQAQEDLLTGIQTILDGNCFLGRGLARN